MHKIVVKGNGKPLIGRIKINGSKNSVLPIMAASLLTSSPNIFLYNVPDLTDVKIMSEVLESLGAKVTFVRNKDYKGNHGLKIDCSGINSDNNFHAIPYGLATKLRTSILTLGPMLGRFNKMSTFFPGGCKIGERPVDLHFKALEKMGVKIEVDGCEIIATKEGRLKGREIIFEKVSVGATQNAMMAATLAEGVTRIENAAVEPEIIDLIHFLKQMGANIVIKDSTIVITGVEILNGCSHRIISDRIEAGTYALAAVMTNGRLELEGINKSSLTCISNELETLGCKIESAKEDVTVISRKNSSLKPVNFKTDVYPKFPTDMQAQLMSAVCISDGISVIEENVFENRFAHVNELRKLGASIKIENTKATIFGIKQFLPAADLSATDLRAAAALLIASITANGESIINQSHYLSRGYEAMPEKLNSCGADISVLRETINNTV